MKTDRVSELLLGRRRKTMSTIRLDIPQLVKTAQQTHGLRYSNYLRYRFHYRHCAKDIFVNSRNSGCTALAASRPSAWL